MLYHLEAMYEIVLKTGKEKQLLKHHPWVFSGAIDSVSPIFKDGDMAKVTASDGRFVAYGWYDEKSHIILHHLVKLAHSGGLPPPNELG